jgi:putative ABC transport system ATP-binding protein
MWSHRPKEPVIVTENRTATSVAVATHDSSTYAAHMADGVKIYGKGATEVRALDGVTVGFERGRFTSIMGPSGSGKSTLMHCIAGLDDLTSGSVWLGDLELSRLSERERTRVRREKVGFVFQAFNLVPTLTARENVVLPELLAGTKPEPSWFDDVVDRFRLRDRLSHRPSELSGGQQQRVAVARALVSKPQILLADEPTGNLDSHSGAEVLRLLREAVDELHQTVVMVTHDANAASYSDRVVFLADGRLVHEMREPTAGRILDELKALGG